MYDTIKRHTKTISPLLHVRPIIREFCWYKLGYGKATSIWFDNWCSISPLRNTLSVRDITRSRCLVSYKVADLCRDGVWHWPTEWADQFLDIYAIAPPILAPNVPDAPVWKDRNGHFHSFSAGIVWDSIRTREIEVVWANVVWFTHCIPRHAFFLWLVIKRKLKTQDVLRQWDVSATTN